tara:strand:+ start:354 stop:494 length:141 start_codon:yes stop_codon:yes gene_type:complete
MAQHHMRWLSTMRDSPTGRYCVLVVACLQRDLASSWHPDGSEVDVT